jgi:hypothetical protein
MGLMTEMDAGFEQLAHRIIRKRHWFFSGCSAADP